MTFMEQFASVSNRWQLARYDFPAESPKGKIVLLHGLGSCIDSMSVYCKYFNRMGYSVYGFDLLGHGASDGKRGHVGRRKYLYRDLTAFIASVKACEDTSLPIFLYGSSLGGNIALSYRQFCKDDNVDAVIVCNPWLELLYTLDAVILKILPFLNFFLPRSTLKHGLNASQFYGTHVRTYRNGLNHSRISIRTFHETMRAAEKLFESKGKVMLPGLVMVSAGDAICNIKAAKRLANDSKSALSYVEFPDIVAHEIIEENRVQQVVLEADAYLMQQFPLSVKELQQESVPDAAVEA